MLMRNANSIQFAATRKVLYAEDDKGLRETMIRMIERTACPEGDTVEVTAVRNIIEARGALDKDTFDAVVTDNCMPTKDEGLMLLKVVNGRENPTPITAMLSSDTKRVADEAEALVATFFHKSRVAEFGQWLKNQLSQLPE